MVSRRQFLRDSGILFGSSLVFGGLPATSNDYKLVANIPAFEMFLYKNGKAEERYDISVGRPNKQDFRYPTETPLGPYDIKSKAPWGKQFAGTWMRFKENPDENGEEQGGWGIHGSPCRELVGYAVSEGCIRMIPEEAKKLMENVPFHTPLKNEYKIFGLSKGFNHKEDIITVRTDIYSIFEKPEKDFIEWLGLNERLIDRGKVQKLFSESEKMKSDHYQTVWEFYHRFIEELEPNKGHPDLVEKNPEIRNYLKKMLINKQLSFELGEIML